MLPGFGKAASFTAIYTLLHFNQLDKSSASWLQQKLEV